MEHTMNRRHIISLSAITALGFALLPGVAVSQQKSLKDQLVGAWTLISIENTSADGKKMQTFGANPNGIFIFDVSGRYSQTQVRAKRSNFKSANRTQVTPAESAAAMNDSLAQFGTWSVDEASKTIIMKIEGSLIPNQEGTEGRRIVNSVTADELRFTNPGPALGGKNESVYRRAK
jgi:hypothetical protein